MDKDDDGNSRDEIFDLFMKWKDTPKNQQASLAVTLKEKIGNTIPSSYGIKIEECNMRYFLLWADSDFMNCKTQPFTCVYDFCQYLKGFHQKEDDWYDTLLPHCIPGSDRQQWIAYNIYRFKFTWKQVCYRLMQKYDLPSRRPEIEKAVKETKFDPSQSIESFNKLFNMHIDELFYDEQKAIQVYRTVIPSEYASMLATTIIIDEGTCFIYTLADLQQRASDIINASDKTFICYTSISHTIYSTESESSICCQDQHSISNCPDTFVLRWPKNDPRNKRNETAKKSEPISFLSKASKTEVKQIPAKRPSVETPIAPPLSTSSIVHPAVAPAGPSKVRSPSITISTTPSAVNSGLVSSKSTFKLSPVSPSKPPVQPTNSSVAEHTSVFRASQPMRTTTKVVNTSQNIAHQSPSSYASGDRFPPQVKKTQRTIKCRNCGADYTYGHNNVCPKRGGRIISRTR